MYIKELQLNDFKSFHEQDFKFYKGLTVVTGSNGSGKSNIFDAIVFALGNNSSKTLRYKHINELIHKGQDADFAKVKLVFDDDTSIERYVSDGASVFRLNDKRTTMEAISAYLKEKKLSYSGHNIVLQDDVKKVVEMSDVDRRKYVDEIANISKFDEQKQKALKNLETVANKINEVKLVLNERKEWLTKLESEKSSAERYLQLDRQKLLTEATILKKERETITERYFYNNN
jgi:chromosome segregation protein